MAINGRNHRKNGRTELNLWVMPNAGFATRSILQPLIDEYERQHPNVQVRLTIHPWSLAWSLLMDVIKGRYMGPKPDVIQIGTTWAATLAYLGALDAVPETGVLPEEDRMSAYIWDPGTQSEIAPEMYCVPWFIDLRVLYYRQDVFNELGLSADSLNDWKGFYQCCIEIQKFLNRGGPIPQLVAPLALSGQKLSVLMHDLAPWIWGAGGDFCSSDLLHSEFDSSSTVRGIDYYFELIQRGFMPLPDATLPQGNFFTGHYAMQFSGSWPIDTLLNPKSRYASPEVAENFGVALMPAGPQGRYTFLGGSNLGVSSLSDNKELAWGLTRFLVEPSRQLSHARSIGSLTARLASMEQLFEGYPAVKKVFWDSIGHARRLPRLITLGSIEPIISKMSGRVLASIRAGKYGDRVLHEEVATANQNIEKVLSLHRYGEQAQNKAASATGAAA
jgi:multiple sugar transport system substrate-binding protein